MARAIAMPICPVKLSSLNCSRSVMASWAAMSSRAGLGALGCFGAFIAVSNSDLLTYRGGRKTMLAQKAKCCNTRLGNAVFAIVGSATMSSFSGCLPIGYMWSAKIGCPMGSCDQPNLAGHSMQSPVPLRGVNIMINIAELHTKIAWLPACRPLGKAPAALAPTQQSIYSSRTIVRH